MELSEKIQKLRKERGLTQEQFAEQLFVSRTAVSKWETGRGTPNMESLQMIAKLYGITLDELLRAEEVIVIAEQENQENMNRLVSWADGICNLAAVMSLILPLYKIQVNDVFYSVPLWQWDGWLATFYWIFPITMAICGLLQILLNSKERKKLKEGIRVAGSVLNIAAIFLLILSGQPYPAVMFFALLLIKGAILLIKQK